MTIHRCSVLAILLASMAMGALAQNSLGIAYKFARLHNASWEIAPQGINNSNVVSGWYFDRNDPYQTHHGFIYKNRNFSTVDFPGAIATEAHGINDDDDVVGIYNLPQNPENTHGFLLHQGALMTIDPAGAIATFPSDINKAGTIVGTYLGADSIYHGFTYSNGVFSTVDALFANGPGTTELLGINNSGIIVGFAVSGTYDVQGFWLFGNTFHFLNTFGAASRAAEGINDRGDVIGERGSFSFLSFAIPTQGVLNTEYFGQAIRVRGINDARMLVGGLLGTAFIATPMLTLDVSSPQNHTNLTNPVHVAATVAGRNPVSQMEVWVNRQKVYSVSGGTLDALIDVPVGANERFVIKAVDTSGAIAKVVDMVNVN